MKTIVIIPTYNEKENIGKLVLKILSLSENFYVLVVDDNSPDGTAEIVKKIATENSKVDIIVRQGKRGFGPSYIDGFKKALAGNSDFIVQMDADFSHNPEDIKKLVEPLSAFGFTIGSRYIGGIRIINWSLLRLILSSLAGVYVRFITRIPVSDPTSGFCAWRKDVLKKIGFEKIKTNGYSFLIEMKYRAFKKGFNFKEVPIIFTERSSGKTKMSKKIIFEAIWAMIKLRFKKI